MPQITYFAVQPFEAVREGLRTREAISAQSRSQAIAIARRLAEKGGAVAFSRTGDPESGEWADAQILGIYGEVPGDFIVPAAA